jgi:NADPH:quinone reductase-like Zn-dependent oxidoreductase
MVRQEDLGIIPKELSAAAAATIPVAGLTALRALRSCPNLLGATVLVVGGGAVAWYAVQLAVLGGARVVALVRSSESADRMRDLGAHGVIRDSPPPAADFDLVIDTVGGALTQVALAACRPFGRLVILGNVGAASAGLAPSALVAAGCLVQGYRLVVDATSTPVGRDLRNLLGWTASGRLQTPPVQEVSWHDSVRVGQAVAGQLGPARTVLRIADR